MHVGDIDASTTIKGKSGKKETFVTVTILDSGGNPVANATVSGMWTWDKVDGDVISGLTGSNGAVTFTTGNYSGSPDLSFTVSGVSGAIVPLTLRRLGADPATA